MGLISLSLTRFKIYIQVAAFGEAGIDLECEADRVVQAAHKLVRQFNQATASQESCQESSFHLDPLAVSHAVKLVTKYGILPNLRTENLENQQNNSQKLLIQDLEALVDGPETLQETALLAGAAIIALIQVTSLKYALFHQNVPGRKPE